MDYRGELQRIPHDEWRAYLTAHSGLPGPRGNLELADAVTAVATREQILELASLDDEYLRFCGTQALGRLLAEDPTDASIRGMLHSRASEPLWRVCEAVARALQVVGDAAPSILAAIAADWITHPDPSVRRARRRLRTATPEDPGTAGGRSAPLQPRHGLDPRDPAHRPPGRRLT